MDKKEIDYIRNSMAKIHRRILRARKGLRSVRDGMIVLREWMTEINATNASMVCRMKAGKEKNETYKAAIRRFHSTPRLNARDMETVRRLNQEIHLIQSQMSEEEIGHFNLAKLIKPGDLFPGFFYKAMALIRRNN